MENNSLLGKLLHLLEAYSEKYDEKPQRILMGYKAYYELMRNSQFSTEVTDSALDPNKRKFKKIRIKITKDDFQLDLE